MDEFGWKDWKEVPYRGDGIPRNSKPRKRFVNRKKQKRGTAITILAIFVITLILVASIYERSETITFSILMVFIVATVLSAGILSANRFRKGYDTDIYEKPKARKRKRSTKIRTNEVNLSE